MGVEIVSLSLDAQWKWRFNWHEETQNKLHCGIVGDASRDISYALYKVYFDNVFDIY